MIFGLVFLLFRETGFAFPDPRPVRPGDLVITEIMADPVPSHGLLPEDEFVELFNRSTEAVRVEGAVFISGNSMRPLPVFTLLPGQYMILCDEEASPGLGRWGTVAAIRGFPAIPNNGGTLRLLGPSKDTLLYQFYEPGWYHDPAKDDGGWSLEIIDPFAQANCEQNWHASQDSRGASPGQANPAGRLNPDRKPPTLLSAYPGTPHELILHFNEPLSAAGASDQTHYRIDQGVSVTAAVLRDGGSREIHLLLEPPLQAGITYLLTVGPGLTDCLGNVSASSQSLPFGLPEPPRTADLLINELLFDPQPGGYDFVELYNRSEKIIDLSGLHIRNARKSGTGSMVRIDKSFLVFPGDLVVITGDTADLGSRYLIMRPEHLVENQLPSMDPGAGNLTISSGGITLDSFDYHSGLHSALISDKRGVSLERIDPEISGQSPGNWFSAAASTGFASPTAPNSQKRPGTIKQEEDGVFLPNPRFSPDGDGMEDVLMILLQPREPGYLLNLIIFDLQGRPVRRLADGLLLKAVEWLSWDGADSSGAKSRTGIYLLQSEFFHPDGRVSRSRKACILAGKLR